MVGQERQAVFDRHSGGKRKMASLVSMIQSTSRIVHDVSFRDTSESLCSRAWRLHGDNRFWRAWVRVFGRDHCQTSYRHYHE
jgi:hypothetical protein